MVVGNGMLARRFATLPEPASLDSLIFASGVSNSKETDPAPFARERQLVEHWLKDGGKRLFVYFSTCSIDDPIEQQSPYVAHKLALENLIAQRANRYLICRVANVVGRGGNPHTVLNYFMTKCRTGEPFDVWQRATRNLIGLNDVYCAVTHLIGQPRQHNRIINIAYPVSMNPVQIVQAIEHFTGQPAQYRLLAKGQPFAIQADECAAILRATGVTMQPEHYLNELLRTYYA